MCASKKERIINTAIDLFAEHGLAKVSLSEIAAKCGISRSCIYRRFPDKKEGIVAAILQIYEDCINRSIPGKELWEAESVEAQAILFRLFFKFPEEELPRMRKITRIIMAEMCSEHQIAGYAESNLLMERERLLADCFTSLAARGKIAPTDAESTARCLNRLVLAYAIEDALHYSKGQNDSRLEEQTDRMIRDCTNILRGLLEIS